MASAAFANRKKLVLFDVDETLTLARQAASQEMLDTLAALRKKAAIGFVSGSDMKKIEEQLSVRGTQGYQSILDAWPTETSTPAIQAFDYAFYENGLVAYKLGEALPSDSFILYVGEERYKRLVNFLLHYIADLDLPIKRGTFVEFRNGMINVSPIGRNATLQERKDFNQFDQANGVRAAFVKVLREKFADYGLTFSIGGQISFDVFPNGWDKRYALSRVEDEQFEEIHFFGDKTDPGGNDHEIFSDPRTIGHTVEGPSHTIRLLKELFLDH
ncbi:Phosphomannomutase [Mycena indigotica]|uniref:Phosphomannomutase n=1 Tax=Mycena indigotica TaxID=2126181 RepID=A0A8H6T2D1_9AGAR|nr:Phosphomannomutase [Mycena indigotica]KAF7309634.1 Phosphomannomutase [Mycena indigotica]